MTNKFSQSRNGDSKKNNKYHDPGNKIPELAVVGQRRQGLGGSQTLPVNRSSRLETAVWNLSGQQAPQEMRESCREAAFCCYGSRTSELVST